MPPPLPPKASHRKDEEKENEEEGDDDDDDDDDNDNDNDNDDDDEDEQQKRSDGIRLCALSQQKQQQPPYPARDLSDQRLDLFETRNPAKALAVLETELAMLEEMGDEEKARDRIR